MKKLIFMLLAFGMIATATAQVKNSDGIITMTTTTTGTKTLDTTDNTETNYLVVKAPGLTYCAVQVVVTKISGTPNGKITFEVSMDGVTYDSLASTDTAHVNNVYYAESTFKLYNPSPYLYYRVKSKGRGTASYQIKAFLLPRKD